ncbi:MAG: hypothetical protein PHY09_00580 [Desulfuromonadaceae bacterium]|nr:hypothetical protein [Desulfuromonadaceae bacterium]MDD5106502.1 hypothetical protein [Desulfuromonadaceae bacterium]
MVRYIVILCSVAGAVIMPLTVMAAEKAADLPIQTEIAVTGKETVFIGPVTVQPSVIEMADKKKRALELRRVANSLETQFISALNATRIFQLVEWNRAPDLEKRATADAVGPNDPTLLQAGRMAGATYAFLPQIDGFEDTQDIAEYPALGRASLSRMLFLSATVQIVDTTTGMLLPDSPSGQLSKKEVIEHARIGQLSGSDEVIVALARDMAKKLSQEAVALLYPARVLTVTGKQIMFNRGSETGFSKGDLVEIYAVQQVKDDDTCETFRNEVPVGQAIISRIEKYQSYAAISGDDLGITKGCVVRFLKSAASRALEYVPPPDVTLPDFSRQGGDGSTPGSSEKPLTWK